LEKELLIELPQTPYTLDARIGLKVLCAQRQLSANSMASATAANSSVMRNASRIGLLAILQHAPSRLSYLDVWCDTTIYIDSAPHGLSNELMPAVDADEEKCWIEVGGFSCMALISCILGRFAEAQSSHTVLLLE